MRTLEQKLAASGVMRGNLMSVPSFLTGGTAKDALDMFRNLSMPRTLSRAQSST